MTTGGRAGADEAAARIEERLAVAEETLRALRAGEADAIVMDSGQGEQRIYTLETEDHPYRRLVERMSEGAALVDADGLIVYANQWLATLLGVPLERLQGGPFSDWLDERESTPLIRQLSTAASGGHRELTLRQADGGRVPVLVGISDAGGPEGLLRCVTVTDLSQQKAQQQQLDRLNAALTDRLSELRKANDDLDVERTRVEEVNVELKVANAELEKVNETIRGFTAVAAHDLRAPLVSIIGFSTILTEKWAMLSDKDRSSFVAIIGRQSHRMSGLIDDLLTVSKIEGGAVNTRPEQIVVGEAISQCLEATVEDTSRVSVSCSPTLAVHADRQHLGRIIDNYLQNAFKYGGPPLPNRGDQARRPGRDPGPRSWAGTAARVRAQAVRQVRQGRRPEREGQAWHRPRTVDRSRAGRGQRWSGALRAQRSPRLVFHRDAPSRSGRVRPAVGPQGSSRFRTDPAGSRPPRSSPAQPRSNECRRMP